MDNFQLRKRKLGWFPEEDGYFREKVLLGKNERSAYVSALTKIINKIIRYINENSDVSNFQKYKLKLENAFQNIHDVSTKLKNLVDNKREIGNILDFCTQKEFWAIDIKKSLQSYKTENNNLNLQHLLLAPFKSSTSKGLLNNAASYHSSKHPRHSSEASSEHSS